MKETIARVWSSTSRYVEKLTNAWVLRAFAWTVCIDAELATSAAGFWWGSHTYTRTHAYGYAPVRWQVILKSILLNINTAFKKQQKWEKPSKINDLGDFEFLQRF